jgi:phospholipid/cholesterol/gamma-HCH transport system substrate-binding protein
MRHSWQNFMVGLCTLVALAGMAGLLLAFGELTWLLERRFEVTLRANAASGLRVGSQVMLEGVPVGEVTAISLKPDAPLPVELIMGISSKQRIPTNVKPTVSAGLLGGGSRIDLRIPATDANATVAMIDPAHPPTLEARFISLSDQMDQILARLTTGQGTLGRLLNDDQLYTDVSDAAQRLTLMLRDLQELVRRVKEEGLELRF